MLRLLARFTLVLGALATLPACSDMITWQEEVKLNDGRVIIVTQKRRCEGATPETATANASRAKPGSRSSYQNWEKKKSPGTRGCGQEF